jgi:hypothetical protein
MPCRLVNSLSQRSVIEADNKRRRTGLEVFICVRTRASLKSCQTVIMIDARVCTKQWGHPFARLRGVVMLLLDKWLVNVLAKSKQLATGVRIIQNSELRIQNYPKQLRPSEVMISRLYGQTRDLDIRRRYVRQI